MGRHIVFGLLLLSLEIVDPLDLSAQNWSRFRGPDGRGVSALQGVPSSWDDGAYAWKVALPGIGHSSPVVVGQRLFVTSAVDEGTVRYLHAMDASSGSLLWSRQVGMSRSHKHSKGSWASSTPVANASHVFVAFADRELLTLAAYDYEGDLVWRRNLGPFKSQHGHGVSPILFDGLVILPNDQQGPSSVMAFDAESGETRWSALRSIRRTSYSTPFVLNRPNESPQLICLSGAMGLTSLNPYTGELNWMTGELPMRTVASPVLAGGVIIATCGGGGKGKLLIAVEPDGAGDVGETHIRYSLDRTLPYVPTPVAVDHYLFLWNDNGVVSCLDAESGQSLWTKRVGGNFSGSPVAIDGKLYCISEAGEVVVLAAAPEYELLGRTSLGEPSHATPVVANGSLYLRTFSSVIRLPADGR